MDPSLNQLARILNVGFERELLKTREHILRNAGHLVRSATSIDEASGLFVGNDFDLVLICHTVPPDDGSRLVAVMRSYDSAAPVLSIATISGESPDGFADYHTGNHPLDLLRKIDIAIRAGVARRPS